MSLFRKSLIAATAAATLATVALPQAAEAGWRHRGYGGGAVAAGIIGGLAAGALIAGATRPAYGYAPVYAEPECWFERRRGVTRDGYVVVRRVRVCE